MTKTSSSAAGVSLRVCPRQTGTLQQEGRTGRGEEGGTLRGRGEDGRGRGGGKKREKCLPGEEIKACHMQERGPEVEPYCSCCYLVRC